MTLGDLEYVIYTHSVHNLTYLQTFQYFYSNFFLSGSFRTFELAHHNFSCWQSSLAPKLDSNQMLHNWCTSLTLGRLYPEWKMKKMATFWKSSQLSNKSWMVILSVKKLFTYSVIQYSGTKWEASEQFGEQLFEGLQKEIGSALKHFEVKIL